MVYKLPKLKFWDFKLRKAFHTTEYKHVSRKGRNFAVAKAPSGTASWRIVAKDFKWKG
jgi:hypothetical protein